QCQCQQNRQRQSRILEQHAEAEAKVAKQAFHRWVHLTLLELKKLDHAGSPWRWIRAGNAACSIRAFVDFVPSSTSVPSELRLPPVMLQTVALASKTPQGRIFLRGDRVAIASLLKTCGQRTRLPRQPLKKNPNDREPAFRHARMSP